MGEPAFCNRFMEDSKALAAPVVNKSADELYRDIVARFIELGIPVPALPPPDVDGAANRRVGTGIVHRRRGVACADL